MEQKRYNAPELLAPVGDMERLISAVRYGADAVYLAGKSFGMRSAPSNFTNEELEEAVKYCHAQGVKVYVTCNILPHNAELAALPDASLEEKEGGGMLLVLASNNSGEGREREWKNGGMGMDIIEVDRNTAYVLLCNLGGEFEPGDLILFDMSFHGENAYLFEVPAPEQLQTELVVPLNESAYDGKTYRWDTATITPISFRLDGSGYGRNETTISLTLNDGTNFSLTNPGNESTPYGTYGSLGHSGTGGGEEDSEIKSSWLFSRLVDLNELSSITVDGVTYSLQ